LDSPARGTLEIPCGHEGDRGSLGHSPNGKYRAMDN
jgi:hypothetical protein